MPKVKAKKLDGSPKMLEEFGEHLMKIATGCLLRDGYASPQAFVVDTDGTIIGLPETTLFFSGPRGKDAFAALMRVLALKGAKMLALVSESWFLSTKDKPDADFPAQGLEHVPGHRECIQIQVQSKTGFVLYVQFFGRDADKRPVLEEREDHTSWDGEGETWEGRMTHWYRTE